MKLSDVAPNSIVLTHELVPSETVEATPALVEAFVTAAGGMTSHAAIIARAKGIPYVANIDIKIFKRIRIEKLIVDGAQGIVITNPSRSTLKKYQTLQKGYRNSYKLFEKTSHLKSETTDGIEVRIFANLENPREADLVFKEGAAGVGLFRSEYLFLSKRQFPTEEEQFETYKSMIEALHGRPLVVRVFDIGGDKKVEFFPEEKDAHYFAQIGFELNPALGCRAIRFLLRFPEILISQLRAIVRASAWGPIEILVPMISDVGELIHVRNLVRQIRKELSESKAEIPIGCMIEVPSSAIMSDVLAQEADFFSIGTNDLVQYVLAADRHNPNTSSLYFSTHPSILRLIRTVVKAANAAEKPVILCGECAADPMMIPLLIGLGIRQFSVATRHIPLVKHTVLKWGTSDASQLAEEAMRRTNVQELSAYLQEKTAR
jgi:phosphotransferase system enzyme I (PtsI)